MRRPFVPSLLAASLLLATACQSGGATPRRHLEVPNAVSGGTRGGGRPDVPTAERARETQARTTLQLAQRDVERSIREHVSAYELHRKEMARWNPKIVEQLREAASLADRHYRLGAVPLATYLEVQSSYLEAIEAIYATQADALTALAEIQLLTGSSIAKP